MAKKVNDPYVDVNSNAFSNKLSINDDDLQKVLTTIDNFTFHNSIDFVQIGQGIPDANKPIILNSQGVIDHSLLATETFYFVSTFTPVGGNEYPDTTGETSGAFWSTENLSSPYVFLTGSLIGREITNNDLMVWGNAGWSIIKSDTNPLLYYKLDGSQGLTEDFNAASHKISSIANGVLDTDAASIGQLKLKEDSLGTPAEEGYILTSTVAGVRSWIKENGGNFGLVYSYNDVEFPGNPGSGNFSTTNAPVKNEHYLEFSKTMFTAVDVGAQLELITANSLILIYQKDNPDIYKSFKVVNIADGGTFLTMTYILLGENGVFVNGEKFSIHLQLASSTVKDFSVGLSDNIKATIPAGGISIGDEFNTSMTIRDLWLALVAPYVKAILSAITINPGGIIEVGTTITISSATLTWTNDSAGNVPINANIAGPGFGAVTLGVSGQIVTAAASTTIKKTSRSGETWTFSANSAQGGAIASRSRTVNWQHRQYYGNHSSAALTEVQLKTLTNLLKVGHSGTYSFPAGTTVYKWLCFVDSEAQPTEFKDAGTNLSVPFEDAIDVSITNSVGLALTLKCYRSTNQLNGAILIKAI